MSKNFDPVKKVWFGPTEPNIGSQHSSVGEAFQEVSRKYLDKTAQIFEPSGEKLTYGEIHRMSMKIADTLREMKISQKDIIGICASNSPNLAAIVFGSFLAAVPISTLDPSFDKNGIKHIFGITKPKVMFCDQSVTQKVQEAFNELNLNSTIISIDGVGENSINHIFKVKGECFFEAVKLDEDSDQTAAIVCSSGSTGYPKGVTLSHRAILYGAFITVLTNDFILCYSSLYWLSGLYTLTSSTLKAATRIITNKPFSPELTFDIIERFKVSTLFTPPSQMALIAQHNEFSLRDLSSLQNYFCGGSAVPYSVIEKVRDCLKSCNVSVGYGMTEVAGACILGPPKLPNSIPFIKKNFQIRIVNESGENLGPTQTGEIVIKPPYKWKGYYKNPESTEEIYKDGWVFSGDLGYFDQDGVLFIIDRKKDILKYKNFHYFPTEIENIIMELDDVVEVCVCGVYDIIMTDLPAAAVIKTKGSNLTENSIYNFVANRLEDFKKLRGGVYFVDTLPKTASGKNIRNKVKEIVGKLYTAQQSIGS